MCQARIVLLDLSQPSWTRFLLRCVSGLLTVAGVGLVLWAVFLSENPTRALLYSLDGSALSLLAVFSILVAASWVTVVHEGAHVLLLRVFTGRWPSMNCTRGLRTIHVGVPLVRMTRGQAVAELVAPVICTTGLGLLVVAYLPTLFTLTLAIGIIIGVAVAVADLYGAYLILVRTEKGATIRDTGQSLQVV